MFIELHLIQNFAPSNLNRDDTGNPKDTDFGGVRRARISSQAIKRAMREEPIFAESTQVEPGIRTKWLARKIAENFEKSGKSKENAEQLAIAFTKRLFGAMDNTEPLRSNILGYFDADEIQFIVKQLSNRGEDTIDDTITKLVKQMGTFTSASDVALFGRMLARKPDTVILDAASQVAHAISTHRVNMDMDFFTAVDDLQEEDETGSSHMGVTAFNSACFYRYARIDFKQLVKNLDGSTELALKTVKGFLRAALRAIPSGKQNSFAAQNPPSFALAVVRKDGMSWSLANAFEKPVRTGREGGFVAPSIEAADTYWGKLSKVYGDEGISAYVLNIDDDAKLEHLAGTEKDNEAAWLNCVLDALQNQEA